MRCDIVVLSREDRLVLDGVVPSSGREPEGRQPRRQAATNRPAGDRATGQIRSGTRICCARRTVFLLAASRLVGAPWLSQPSLSGLITACRFRVASFRLLRFGLRARSSCPVWGASPRGCFVPGRRGLSRSSITVPMTTASPSRRRFPKARCGPFSPPSTGVRSPRGQVRPAMTPGRRGLWLRPGDHQRRGRGGGPLERDRGALDPGDGARAAAAAGAG